MPDQSPSPPVDEQPDSAGMSPDELAEAKRYGRLELICGLSDKAIDIAYLGVAAYLLAQPADRWLNGFSLLHRNDSLRLLLLFLLLTSGHIAVSFPLSFYSGHILEHRFSLSTQTFAGWLWRYAKRNLLGLAFGHGPYSRIILADLDHRADLVARGGGGLFPGQRLAGSIGPGAHSAAVLQDRKTRRPGIDQSNLRFGRGHGPID